MTFAGGVKSVNTFWAITDVDVDSKEEHFIYCSHTPYI